MKYARIAAAALLFVALLLTFTYRIWSVSWAFAGTTDYGLDDPMAYVVALGLTGLFWYFTTPASLLGRSRRLAAKVTIFAIAAIIYCFMIIAFYGVGVMAIAYGYCGGQYGSDQVPAICQSREILPPILYGLLGVVAFIGIPPFVAGVFLHLAVFASGSTPQRAEVKAVPQTVLRYSRKKQTARLAMLAVVYVLSWMVALYCILYLLDSCTIYNYNLGGPPAYCRAFMLLFMPLAILSMLAPPAITLALLHITRELRTTQPA